VLSPVVFLLLLFTLAVVCFEVLIESFVLFQRRVEAVFNVVVDAAGHELLDLHPLVAECFMQLH